MENGHQELPPTLSVWTAQITKDSRNYQRTPTTEELEAIDHIGFVRVAADELATLAQDGANPQREIAAEALQRLYVLHIRHMAAIQ